MLQHRTCLQDQTNLEERSEVGQEEEDHLMDKAQDTEDVASSVMVPKAADVRDFQKETVGSTWISEGHDIPVGNMDR